MARASKDIRERSAEGGVTAMTDMQRSGRIRRQILQQDSRARTGSRDAVGCAAHEYRPDFVAIRRSGQREIDEARACDIDLRDGRRCFDPAYEGRREVSRLLPERRCSAQGDVACEIPVPNIASSLKFGIEAVDIRPAHFSLKSPQSVTE
jgi:hypothetical protein